jgi:acyl dehydratase
LGFFGKAIIDGLATCGAAFGATIDALLDLFDHERGNIEQ